MKSSEKELFCEWFFDGVKRLNLNSEDIARDLGVSISSVRRWMTSVSKPQSKKMMIRIVGYMVGQGSDMYPGLELSDIPGIHKRNIPDEVIVVLYSDKTTKMDEVLIEEVFGTSINYVFLSDEKSFFDYEFFPFLRKYLSSRVRDTDDEDKIKLCDEMVKVSVIKRVDEIPVVALLKMFLHNRVLIIRRFKNLDLDTMSLYGKCGVDQNQMSLIFDDRGPIVIETLTSLRKADISTLDVRQIMEDPVAYIKTLYS